MCITEQKQSVDSCTNRCSINLLAIDYCSSLSRFLLLAQFLLQNNKKLNLQFARAFSCFWVHIHIEKIKVSSIFFKCDNLLPKNSRSEFLLNFSHNLIYCQVYTPYLLCFFFLFNDDVESAILHFAKMCFYVSGNLWRYPSQLLIMCDANLSAVGCLSQYMFTAHFEYCQLWLM
jgi:hypothetical protein